MFFGQEVKTNQNKATTMTMDADVKLSQAVLDPAGKNTKKEPVCLMAEIQGKSFILAVLDPSQSWQCPLDLMLAAGTEVKFYLKGQGTIHLTGYEFREDDDDDDEDYELSMSSEDEMDDENDLSSDDEAESKHVAKKLKVKNGPITNGVKPPTLKCNKEAGDQNGMQDTDDDDSDDEDLSFGSDDDDEDDDEDEELSDGSDVDLDGLDVDEEEDDDDDDDEEDSD